jgi:hypothetical protein
VRNVWSPIVAMEVAAAEKELPKRGTTAPIYVDPTAFIIHQVKTDHKGPPQLAHHTTMIFGSDGGPP